MKIIFIFFSAVVDRYQYARGLRRIEACRDRSGFRRVGFPRFATASEALGQALGPSLIAAERRGGDRAASAESGVWCGEVVEVPGYGGAWSRRLGGGVGGGVGLGGR